MPRLPVVSGKELVKFLLKQGFVVTGRKGSHVKLKDMGGNVAIVPMHKTIATGTLLEILDEAKVTREDLTAFFGRKRGN